MGREQFAYRQCLVKEIASDEFVGDLVAGGDTNPGNGNRIHCTVSNDGADIILSLDVNSSNQQYYHESTMFAEFYTFDKDNATFRDLDPDPGYTLRYKYPLTNIGGLWDPFSVKYYNDSKGIIYSVNSGQNLKSMFIVFDKACGLEIETEVPGLEPV